ncbi:BTAD domain-containing putative transcriptional regulator [Streptomyces sp. HUAS TT3]|uniref:BTAD domain-containing putative transcriptional regulator n=1 Tax=Streptomyces sp. HUAS TT3 TaxID=3447510 RepID=UPI003F656649
MAVARHCLCDSFRRFRAETNGYRGRGARTAAAEVRRDEALELWRGRPLGEVADTEFAQPLIRRLTAMYESACAELVRAHTDADRPELALSVAERLAA